MCGEHQVRVLDDNHILDPRNEFSMAVPSVTPNCFRQAYPATQPFRKSHVFTAWVRTTYPNKIAARSGQ
jgi:hypothetical protein